MSLDKRPLEKILNAKKKNSTELRYAPSLRKYIPNEIGSLINLRTLRIFNNIKLSTLPKEIGNLKNLNELVIYGCIRIEIPEELNQLTKLSILKLNENNLESLPLGFGQIKNLSTLDLSFNKFSEINKEIWKLRKLTYFNISYCNINQIPKEIELLKNLEVLDFSNNKKIEVLPIELFQLKKLKKLYISSCSITHLPKEIGLLENLIELDLSDNKFTNVPKEIEKLQKLSKLQISKCKITHLPKSIGMISRLKILNFANNRLLKIPKEIGKLKSIETIQLQNNRLTQIPETIGELNKLKQINLSSNPIENIPEEIYEYSENCILGLRDYFTSIKKKVSKNNEIKLIIIGNTTSGKTSFINYLLNRKFNSKQPSTHGINITNWSTEFNKIPITANIWDFGGQEFYHATHKLFLSSGALFLVFWDKKTNMNGMLRTEIYIGRTKESINLEHFHYLYWLESIRYYSQDSGIMMLQNKVDELIDKEDLMPVCYKESGGFNVIKPCRAISIKKVDEYDRGIIADKTYLNEFENIEIELKRNLFNHIPQYTLSIFWQEIRDKIRLRKDENIWLYKDYKTFCFEIDNSIEIKTITKFLHDTGVILYYGDNTDIGNVKLKSVVFINPNFITNLVYEILDYEVLNRNGYFSINHLKQKVEKILHEYKNIKISYDDFLEIIIELMQAPNFELVFKHPSKKNTFIAPQYLDEKLPKGIDLAKKLKKLNNTVFVLYFPFFLPKSLISRFIVRFGVYPKSIYYKYGIIIEKNKDKSKRKSNRLSEIIDEQILTYAYCDFEQKKIYIKNDLYNRDSKLIREIFQVLMDISDYNDDIEVSLNDRDFVPLSILKDNASAGMGEFVYKQKHFFTTKFNMLSEIFEVEKPTNQINMEINIDNKGQINIVEKLKNLKYSNDFKISQIDQDKIIESLNLMRTKDKNQLVSNLEEFNQAKSPSQKKSLAKKIGNILEKYVVGIATNITAETISKIILNS